MLTSSHAGWAIHTFKRSAYPRWAVAGSIAPDAPAIILSGVRLVVDRGPRNLPDGVYQVSPWREVHLLTHSVLVPAAIAAFPNGRGQALAAGWLSHLTIDYLTHHDDAWSPLWPLTAKRWLAPVSYWQVGHHARPFAALDASGLLLGAFRRRDAASAAAAAAATAMLIRLIVAPGNPLNV